MSTQARPSLSTQLTRVWHRLRGGELSRRRASLSIAVGLFVAALPIYGFQLALVLLICLPLRLDAAVAYVAAHVSNPLTLPLLLALEIELGSLILDGRHAALSIEAAQRLGISPYLKQLAVGAPLLGVCLALLGAAVSFALVKHPRIRSGTALSTSIARTCSRYAHASAAIRSYVENKLLNDPAIELLTAHARELGATVDAGCGYGQVGLCLLDAGHASRVVGFDNNPERIREAQKAAGMDATFLVMPLTAQGWPAADTILLLDSLHYAEANAQDQALESAAAALRPGGQLFLREPRLRANWRSALTRLFETVAIRWRHQPRAVFRPPDAYWQTLERAGLECRFVPSGDWGPFDNFVLIAVKPLQASMEGNDPNSSRHDAA